MAIVPGSCGELAQGLLGEKDVLITCPVSLYSKIELEFKKPAAEEEKRNYKSYQAVRKFLALKGLKRDFSLLIDSELPRGKGMASSSADIAASLLAAAKACHLPLASADISQIALSIEPTDGVFFSGIVAYDHLNGSICEYLGPPPLMKLVIFDFGGEVDTLSFNERPDLKKLREQNKAQFTEAYELVKKGIRAENPVLVAKGATISALANQKILPKKDLEKLILIANSCGALGVNVAHSGTVASIMFDLSLEKNIDICLERVKKECPELSYVACADLISGGEIANGN